MSKSSKYWIHCAIMFIITFGIGALPPFGGDITPLGMDVLGVFLGVLYGWTFLGFFWTSCFGILALGLTQYSSITNVLIEGFSSMVALQVLLLFILVSYLIDSGFVELVTGWFMTRKIAHGRPFLLIFLILFGCGVVNMLGLGFGGVFFVWAIMYEIFNLLGYKKGDMLVTYMIYGAAICCALANAVFPFVTFPIMFKAWLAPLGYTIPDLGWLAWQFIFFTLYMIVYVAFGKFALRLDVQPFIDRAEEVAQIYQGKKATKQQKIATAIVVMFLIVTLLPSFLPASSALKAYLAQYGLIGATLLVIVVTSVIRLNGEPLTNWQNNAAHGINWDLVIMFVATTPIANALESPDSGILSTIFALVMPLIQNMSPFVFTVCALAIFLILTQFAHNVVVIIALAPTILSIAAPLGVNVGLLAAAICIVGQTAFLTPGASSPAAAVHGNTAWVDVKQAYILGIVAIVLSSLCVLALYPLGLLLF